MADKKQLGLFWEEDLLYFAESNSSGNILNSFIIPFSENDNNPLAAKHPLAETIIETFNSQKISEASVNLSLPTKDIIFRTFVIPWMQSTEIKEVVEFEASKYLPFSLEDLHYSFHSSTFNEEGTRRIRVSLVAIKKITLEKYTSILNDAYIDTNIIEPGPLSLIRVLTNQQIVNLEDTIAIVENSGFSAGKIVIANEGIPHFVREFQLKSSSTSQEEETSKDLENKLLNEIRISLEYFHRQDDQLRIQKILIISTSQSSELENTIKSELNLDAQAINISEITNSIENSDIGHINAYGISLAETVKMPSKLYLSSDKPTTIKPARGVSQEREFNLKSVIAAAGISIFLIIAVFFSSNRPISSLKSTLVDLRQKLGTKANATTASYKMRANALSLKLKNLNSIRTEGNTGLFLEAIPAALPKGTWITDINVTYPNTIVFKKKESKNKKKSRRSKKTKTTTAEPIDIPAVIIDIKGYAYSEDTSEQFGLINDILKELQNNKDFAKNFKRIILATIQSTRIDEHKVTSFTIKCD